MRKHLVVALAVVASMAGTYACGGISVHDVVYKAFIGTLNGLCSKAGIPNTSAADLASTLAAAKPTLDQISALPVPSDLKDAFDKFTSDLDQAANGSGGDAAAAQQQLASDASAVGASQCVPGS